MGQLVCGIGVWAVCITGVALPTNLAAAAQWAAPLVSISHLHIQPVPTEVAGFAPAGPFVAGHTCKEVGIVTNKNRVARGPAQAGVLQLRQFHASPEALSRAWEMVEPHLQAGGLRTVPEEHHTRSHLLFHEVVLDNKAPGTHEPRKSSKEQEYILHMVIRHELVGKRVGRQA